MDTDNNKPVEPPINFKVLPLVFEIGYNIAIPLAILAFVGRIMDKHFETSPLFIIIGLILSMVISVIAIWRMVNKVIKSNN